MKLKYYTLLKNLEGKEFLSSLIAYNAAPTIEDEKPSSLISFNASKKNLLTLWQKYKFQVCDELGLNFYEIKGDHNKKLVLFFKEDFLEEHLYKRDSLKFLKNIGYKEKMSLIEMLNILRNRFEVESCPHEVGIFLGIPIEDVEAFIENKGEGYLFYKYWKVYHNPEEASEIFNRYDNSKEVIINFIEREYCPI
ncbi:uncharacterized protein DUF3793 [Natranaerovirga pectinivora]|uniref:Uncharacterized protein DUF3793 n=2 Tax=Natranaerovirga pectinivora TaxID=682400 RepID=A0A4R3MME5_9FIRM|nr:uncharacterized protein DUF3793 [Natranaerovirga pectinivora]